MNNSETDLIFILSGDIHTGPQAEDTTEPHFWGGGGLCGNSYVARNPFRLSTSEENQPVH